MDQSPRAVIVFEAGVVPQPIVFRSLNSAADWLEATDIDDGEYERIAWFDDGETIEVDAEHVARLDLRVKLTPTGRRDLPALRTALARTRPDLVEADATAVHAFAAEQLAAEDTWRQSRWGRRLGRWLHRQRPT